MKSYKGVVYMTCKDKKCKIVAEVQPDCINCPKVKIEILDLESKSLATFNAKQLKREK